MNHSRTVSLAGRRCGLAFVCVIAACWVSACQPAASGDESGMKTQPIYDPASGKLQELRADLDGDGKNDAVAYMDGTRLQRIEVDRDNDGQVDRWEYYDAGVGNTPATVANRFDRWAVLARAEESALKGGRIVRREFYVKGVLDHVEEDTDQDGRSDKWEVYTDGVLARVDLDLLGKGFPNRRLIYGPGGDVTRIESDDAGRGTFTPLSDSH